MAVCLPAFKTNRRTFWGFQKQASGDQTLRLFSAGWLWFLVGLGPCLAFPYHITKIGITKPGKDAPPKRPASKRFVSTPGALSLYLLQVLISPIRPHQRDSSQNGAETMLSVSLFGLKLLNLLLVNGSCSVASAAGCAISPLSVFISLLLAMNGAGGARCC